MNGPSTETNGTTESGDENAIRRLGRVVATSWRRALSDLVVVGLWVLALAVVFLETAWPQWAFYAALLAGVVLYTWFTARG